MILPFVRSYGDMATRTRSPGMTRIRWILIFPLTWPIISWPVSSFTRNWALGIVSVISPSISTVPLSRKALKVGSFKNKSLHGITRDDCNSQAKVVPPIPNACSAVG